MPICDYGSPLNRLTRKYARSRREWHHPVALLTRTGGKDRNRGNRNPNGGLPRGGFAVRFFGLSGHGEKIWVFLSEVRVYFCLVGSGRYGCWSCMLI